MKRQLEDKHVAKIKQMLIQNYKALSIRDIMKQKYGITITDANIQNIKKLEAYKDVRPDLNSALRAIYPAKTRYDTYSLSVIKWALAEGISYDEIIRYYDVSKTTLTHIRLGHMPYYSIAPEYNSRIEKRFKGKKRANIDKKMVLAIKKEYVDKEGGVLLSKIAEKNKIDKATVSLILNFRYYKEVGISYNSKIISIKKKKDAEKTSKQKERIWLKIEKENQNNQVLREKKELIEAKLKESNTKLKNLRASA